MDISEANMNERATPSMSLLRVGNIELYRCWNDDGEPVLLATASLDSGAGQPWVLRSELALYTTPGMQRVAIDIGLSYLAELGVIIRSEPHAQELERDRARLVQYIDCALIDGATRRREITSPLWAGAMDVLGDLILPALFCNIENLAESLVVTMTLPTVGKGYCSASGYAFSQAVGIPPFRFCDLEQSLSLAKVALRLSSEDGSRSLATRVRMCFGVLLIPWTRHVRFAQSYIKDAVRKTYESCDLLFAEFSQRYLVSSILFGGAPLVETIRLAEDAVDLARDARSQLLVDMILAQPMLVSTLQGTYAQTFKSKGLDSGWNENLVHGFSRESTAAFAFWIHRLQISVLFRDWDGGLEAEVMATELLGASLAHIEVADLSYYGALCRAAAFSRATQEDERESHLIILKKHCDYLQSLAQSCPDNFGDRAALAGALLARVQGRSSDAELLYERAIELARKGEFVQNEAVALEAAADYYFERNLRVIAEALIRNVRYAYLHWGAEAKAEEIETRPMRVIGRSRAKPGQDVQGMRLDTRTVVAALHDLSGEITLPRILKLFIRNVLEHAGGERCAVVLIREDGFRIEAEANVTLDGPIYAIESRVPREADLPLDIFMTVVRTCQKVLLDDASCSDEFSNDRCVSQRGIRSVLCVPLLRQSKLVGILYVENNVISAAFTEEIATLLEVLASQAAISFENAQLYADTVRSNELRDAAEQELRESKKELARIGNHITMGQFVAAIAHEVSQPLVSIATGAGAALRFMRRDVPDLVEVEDALERIQFDSARAHDIVQSLRDLVKRSAASFSAFDVSDVIEEVLRATREQCERHAIRLDVSAVSDKSVVWGNRVQIQQVVFILVVNAIEAMQEITGRERRLILLTSTIGGYVRLVIEDTGIGVAEGSVEHIFAPFVTTKPQGMGMGLAICRSIVQAHAGRLSVERLIPYGTRFEVMLSEPGCHSPSPSRLVPDLTTPTYS
ncbi:GAF domain-containing sensor histidine kinase [Burkholderia sp. Ac-20365]|uniref:GAF domain-containing sensor histidine kinase n=1 Tax=Burkholderia sp. Ac-20365 TaxID=2703897 RepID=UPI00197CB1DF|nr:GAF domain-containing sensor histidine kinase [Burkholderia sp. Ac-20365]MBN3759235.1 GAF domain-containing sensor histidine kinase [Burkholderia sp. Ac-20365]